MTAPPVLTFCDYASLVEAWRELKNYLQLSNAEVDRLCQFADGWTDKVIGPTNTKNASAETLTALMWVFAAKCTITVDVEKAKSLAEHWEQRNASQFRATSNRISKELVKRAKPLVMKDYGKLGGQVRANLLSPMLVEQICRKAGLARMKKLSRKERRELARKAGLASAAKRKLIAELLTACVSDTGPATA